MTGVEVARLIGPWLDDELDVRSVVEVETHPARCACNAAVSRQTPCRTVERRESWASIDSSRSS